MDGTITLCRSDMGEWLAPRHDESEGPIVVMGDDTSTGPASDQITLREARRHGTDRLRISETHPRPLPSVDPEHRDGGRFQQRLVECHLIRPIARSRVWEEKQGFKGWHLKTKARIERSVALALVIPRRLPYSIPMAKPALGRGLGALINTRVAAPAPVEELGERIQNLALDQIVPSPLQPRKEFRSEHLQELIESIRERGVIQPLIVRKVGDKFELIAGERRFRASTELKLKEVPAIVREATDREVLELALIENLQREDLNPIEEAAAYERLHKDFEMTQEDISKRVGKSRASVANAMRLLDLQEEVQSWLKQGRLSVGHAKVLLSLKSPEEQKFLAEQIIRQGASVRVAEKLAAEHLARTGKAASSKKSGSSSSGVELSPALNRVQNLLTHRLSTRVVLNHSEKRGTIQIEYYGSDDLNRLLDVLGISGE